MLRTIALNFHCNMIAKRSFSVIRPNWKKVSKQSRKNSKSSSGDTVEDDDVMEIDPNALLKNAGALFTKTVELHGKKLNVLKQGKSNPNIFNELKLQNGIKFTDVASAASKGKNSLLITVFDPSNTKNVISTIIGSGLNLNPERLPNNDQMLKVMLPPPTSESRQLLVKSLKQVYESYKNSSLDFSLGSIRSGVLKQLTALDKKNDSVRKALQDLEKLHKTYVTQLQEQLKQAEKSIMN